MSFRDDGTYQNFTANPRQHLRGLGFLLHSPITSSLDLLPVSPMSLNQRAPRYSAVSLGAFPRVALDSTVDRITPGTEPGIFGGFSDLPSGKLTWQWKCSFSDRKYVFKWWIFHCYVSLLDGKLWKRLAPTQTKNFPH